MQKPNLNKLLAKWKKRLRLQDWNITIEYKPGSIMGEGNIGETKLSPNNFFARIWIRDPKDIETWIPTLENVELTVVHELVHLMVVWEKEQEEVVIERIAQALMEI